MPAGSGWAAWQGERRADAGRARLSPCTSAPRPGFCRQGAKLPWVSSKGGSPPQPGWAVCSPGERCPALPAGCLPRPPCLPAGHWAQNGCRIPAAALPSRDLGQVWGEVEEGGWELKRGLAALVLSCGGREHGPTSSSCLHLPVSLAATLTWDFSSSSLPAPAWAEGDAL